MAQEIERAGIPTVVITALNNIAESIGCYRIVSGAGVLHPTGNPSLEEQGEKRYRRDLIELALEALSTAVDSPRVFESEEANS